MSGTATAATHGQAFNRAGYDQELTALRGALDGPTVSAPDTATVTTLLVGGCAMGYQQPATWS